MSGVVTAAVVGGGAALGASALGATAATAGLIGVGALGATTSLEGASMQSQAAQSAAQTQANAENNATAAQQGIYAQNQANLAPFIQQGTAASTEVGQLEGLNGGTPSSILNTLQQLPGYQFGNQQGLLAVQSGAASRGLGISAPEQTAAAQYATQNANSYYNNLLTGVQNTANMGANAAGGLASVGAQTGSSIAGTTVGAGNALAQGITGSANALAGGLTGTSNSLTSAVYANQILNPNNNGGGFNTPNINSDGAISNSFENAQQEYANTTFN
jgi:hypothetical protein